MVRLKGKMMTSKKLPHGTELLIWNFPHVLKNRLKSVCAAEDITMREKLIQLVQEYVDGKQQRVKKNN